MKNTIILFSTLSSFMMVGCNTTHNLTYPKGKWQIVNTKGFIPPDTAMYRRVETLATMELNDDSTTTHHDPKVVDIATVEQVTEETLPVLPKSPKIPEVNPDPVESLKETLENLK